VFRTRRQIESTLRTNCLAVLPNLATTASRSFKDKALAAGTSRSSEPTGASTLPRAADRVPLAPSSQTGSDKKKSRPAAQGLDVLHSDVVSIGEQADAGRKLIATKKAFMRQVIDQPLSAFTEAFRSIKVAADLSSCKVIGITSTVPGEGKSTVASNLAELVAHSGKRVILLDGDLRNPSISRSLAPDVKTGLLEVLDKRLSLNDAIVVDPQTGLNFVPSVNVSRLAHTNEVLSSELFADLVQSLRKTYDYVIIDFPPIAPVVDVRATTHLVDSYIYVVEWGRTRTNLAQHQLEGFPELHDRLLGVVLNKADVRVLERYESYYGRYYYKNYYGAQSYSS
jgi:succinoglycan biosynthesis transport protein ExoP